MFASPIHVITKLQREDYDEYYFGTKSLLFNFISYFSAIYEVLHSVVVDNIEGKMYTIFDIDKRFV